MTKRAFYTDPLAAAWMAKNFGMKFTSGVNSTLISVDDLLMGEALGWRLKKDSDDWVYIHSDSLHLLEPIINDVLWTVKDGFFDVQRICDVYDKPKYNTWKLHKIIERNGIPFMWPEFEE